MSRKWCYLSLSPLLLVAIGALLLTLPLFLPLINAHKAHVVEMAVLAISS